MMTFISAGNGKMEKDWTGWGKYIKFSILSLKGEENLLRKYRSKRKLKFM